ncbi:resistance to homoserine/threonine (RhtB) family protein [Jatrophihabitans endophyticus]|uniref:Resistance to homoserine/threonine (RhtB) family protein n=1 Tax=Jatrophihabitans endophyticus TaxID=1206085 RepID=A0A1M5KS85_9ACTN|nr:LysE family translocator [Jatrophihabitans endophyticus]SHG55023.1 resistance to homoserine/threonine (RhtB) family protein [Jatrophihabitans endophyticus]
MLVALGSFALAAAVLVLLPGPDTLVIIRSIVRGGRRRGVATVLGIQTGLVVWITAAVLGLAALLRASEVAYTALRIVGAAYLIWLGVQSWRSRGRAVADPAVEGAAVEGAAGAAGRRALAGTGFRAGLLSNLFNPKVGVFFVTFLPAFVPAGSPVTPTLLLFGAVFVLLNLAYQLPLVLLATKVTELFSRERVRRRMDAVAGAVLIGFGVRLATEG